MAGACAIVSFENVKPLPVTGLKRPTRTFQLRVGSHCRPFSSFSLPFALRDCEHGTNVDSTVTRCFCIQALILSVALILGFTCCTVSVVIVWTPLSSWPVRAGFESLGFKILIYSLTICQPCQ